MAESKKPLFSAGDVHKVLGKKPEEDPAHYAVDIRKEGFNGGRVLTVTGDEKTLVEVGGDAIVAALNKAAGR